MAGLHRWQTLADRLLEVSGNITQRERESAQHLDNLKVRRPCVLAA
jgi:translation elongation factor EF-4